MAYYKPSAYRSISFYNLLDNKKGELYINRLAKSFGGSHAHFFERWYKLTGEAKEIYPSQGLLVTPFDYLPYLGKTILSDEKLWQTILVRWYLLELFNHPDRLINLIKVEKEDFVSPQKVDCKVMTAALKEGLSLSVHDFGMNVIGTDEMRISRRQLLERGPFIKLGKYARVPFSGGAMPDIFGCEASLATMAMCHALVCLPRNGMFSDIKRQADLAKGAFNWMEQEPLLALRKDKVELLKRWQHNLVGVIEPDHETSIARAKSLYKVGIRSFRVYSPEPGKEALITVQNLRKEFGDKIEIFAGQAASLRQAYSLQKSGADGLYLGIGGGGRCITAMRSGSTVNWPELLWLMRGEINIPSIIEGGASEQIGVTLLLGASGIGVTRMAGGGTIESPGGLMYLVDDHGKWFKPYGGEASARTKYQDNKVLAFGIPSFVEGETTKAFKSYIPHVQPTLTENILLLLEDVILSMVFRGVSSISQLHNINPSPLRRITSAGHMIQRTH